MLCRYEKKATGELDEEDIAAVPDVYVRNQELDEAVKALRVELRRNQDIAANAQGTWDKFRKERDFHRMHHKRVMQVTCCCCVGCCCCCGKG